MSVVQKRPTTRLLLSAIAIVAAALSARPAGAIPKLPGLTDKASTAPAATDTATFESPEAKLRFKYPSSWAKAGAIPQGLLVQFVLNPNHPATEPNHVLVVAVNPLRHPDDPRALNSVTLGTLDSYAQRPQMKFKLVDDSTVTVAGVPARRLLSTCVLGNINLSNEDVLLVRGPAYFHLHLTVPPGAMEASRGELQRLLDSIEWLD